MNNEKKLQENKKALHIGSVTNRTFECTKCGGKYELLAGNLPEYCSNETEEENKTCGGKLIETTVL